MSPPVIVLCLSFQAASFLKASKLPVFFCCYGLFSVGATTESGADYSSEALSS